MKTVTILLVLGTTLALSSASQARPYHRPRVIVTPMATTDAAWPVDYYIVPRYRYRPEDDRVDPYGKPVALSYPEPGGNGIGQ
jgi:hypothetical protein